MLTDQRRVVVVRGESTNQIAAATCAGGGPTNQRDAATPAAGAESTNQRRRVVVGDGGGPASGADILGLFDVTNLLQAAEDYGDYFKRIEIFIQDNLLSATGLLVHHGTLPLADEIAAPMVENLIVLIWLQGIHPLLPAAVKRSFDSQLQLNTLASIKVEILSSVDQLLAEIQVATLSDEKEAAWLQSNDDGAEDTEAPIWDGGSNDDGAEDTDAPIWDAPICDDVDTKETLASADKEALASADKTEAANNEKGDLSDFEAVLTLPNDVEAFMASNRGDIEGAAPDQTEPAPPTTERTEAAAASAKKTETALASANDMKAVITLTNRSETSVSSANETEASAVDQSGESKQSSVGVGFLMTSCGRCGREFESLEQLRRHAKTHERLAKLPGLSLQRYSMTTDDFLRSVISPPSQSLDPSAQKSAPITYGLRPNRRKNYPPTKNEEDDDENLERASEADDGVFRAGGEDGQAAAAAAAAIARLKKEAEKKGATKVKAGGGDGDGGDYTAKFGDPTAICSCSECKCGGDGVPCSCCCCGCCPRDNMHMPCHQAPNAQQQQQQQRRSASGKNRKPQNCNRCGLDLSVWANMIKHAAGCGSRRQAAAPGASGATGAAGGPGAATGDRKPPMRQRAIEGFKKLPINIDQKRPINVVRPSVDGRQWPLLNADVKPDPTTAADASDHSPSKPIPGDGTYMNPHVIVRKKPIVDDAASRLCKICGKSYPNRTKMRAHKRYVHDNPRAFCCEQCGKYFPKKSAMEHHAARVHEKRRDHKCTEPGCGQEYYKSTHLRLHVGSKHSGTEHRICEECGNVFNSPDLLKYHVKRVHLKEKNFTCEFCLKEFMNKQDIKKHRMGVHFKERPHLCEDCGKGFTLKQGLKNHVETVHQGVRKWQCSLCDKKYAYRPKLAYHLNTKHKIE